MGATNDIKHILQDYEIKARSCYSCSHSFTEKDLKENNWAIEYRTNHDTDWTDFPLRVGRGWIAIEIALYHESCPANKCIKCGYDAPIGAKICPSCWLEEKEKSHDKN